MLRTDIKKGVTYLRPAAVACQADLDHHTDRKLGVKALRDSWAGDVGGW